MFGRISSDSKRLLLLALVGGHDGACRALQFGPSFMSIRPILAMAASFV